MTNVQPAPANLAHLTGEWRIDPAASSTVFRTKAMWILPVKGTAKVAEGHGRVGEDGTVEGRVVIDATSISTGMKKRDAHLQTADFFDTATYPTFEYELTGARVLRPGRVAVDGTLTISGQRRPLSFEADVTVEGSTAKVHGEVDHLDRSDWGIGFTKMGAQLDTRLVLDATFRRV